MVKSTPTSQGSGGETSPVLKALRRRAWLIAACCLVGAGIALAFSLTQTRQYTSEASLLFRDPGFDQRLFGASVFEAGLDPAREAATNLRLVSLDAVADQTAEDLGTGISGDAVAAQVEASLEGQSDVVSLVATDPDPEFAAVLANAFAENYIEFRRDADRAKIAEARSLVEADLLQLSSDAGADQEAEALREQVSQLKTLEALQTGNAELVQRADASSAASSPKPVQNAVVGGFLGILLGMGLALVLERLDKRLRAPSDLEEAFGLPVLGAVPDSGALTEDPDTEVAPLPFVEAEAFRMVRTRLRYFNVDRDVRTVLVTSSSPGEGKSTIAWNLARTAAEAGVRALLVEADFHQPTAAARHGLEPLPGLAELLTHQVSQERATQHVRVTARGNGAKTDRHLDVVAAGATPPNPAELLESEEMAKLLSDLAKDYELIVIDTPPVSVLADAIPLIKLVNGVLVVGRLGRTTRDDAVHLRSQLLNLDASVLGVVANRVRKKGRGYGYNYGSGYYGHGEQTNSRPAVGVPEA